MAEMANTHISAEEASRRDGQGKLRITPIPSSYLNVRLA